MLDRLRRNSSEKAEEPEQLAIILCPAVIEDRGVISIGQVDMLRPTSGRTLSLSLLSLILFSLSITIRDTCAQEQIQKVFSQPYDRLRSQSHDEGVWYGDGHSEGDPAEEGGQSPFEPDLRPITSWEEAKQMAKSLVGQMTIQEKVCLSMSTL